MATALETFRIIAPEFSSTSDATVNNWLTLAVQEHNTTVWGNSYVTAMAYFAAHQMASTPGLGAAASGAAGPLTQQKDGDLSRSYGTTAIPSTMSSGDQSLMLTTYGQKYLHIRNSRALTGAYVVQPST